MRILRGGALAGALLMPLLTALWPAAAQAQVSVQVDVHFGSYPRLVRVPGYPVYYSPGAPANLFFYDGLYWLYVDERWYTSAWYDGPWSWVDPFDVPLYVLRVPVRYYPVAPVFFRPWRPDAPPRWGEHWGPDWQRRHSGWDRWDRRQAPPPAPLPVYQRPYAGERYPSPQEQRELQQRQYRYRPREAVTRAHLPAPAPGVSTGRTAVPLSPGHDPRGEPDRPQHAAPPQRPPAPANDRPPASLEPRLQAPTPHGGRPEHWPGRERGYPPNTGTPREPAAVPPPMTSRVPAPPPMPAPPRQERPFERPSPPGGSHRPPDPGDRGGGAERGASPRHEDRGHDR